VSSPIAVNAAGWETEPVERLILGKLKKRFPWNIYWYPRG